MKVGERRRKMLQCLLYWENVFIYLSILLRKLDYTEEDVEDENHQRLLTEWCI